MEISVVFLQEDTHFSDFEEEGKIEALGAKYGEHLETEKGGGEPDSTGADMVGGAPERDEGPAQEAVHQGGAQEGHEQHTQELQVTKLGLQLPSLYQEGDEIEEEMKSREMIEGGLNQSCDNVPGHCR